MVEAVLFAIDGHLAYTGLHVLIHVRVGETQHQAVGPCLVDEAYFTDDRLVVVGVVEAFHAYFVPRVDIGRNRAVGIEGEYFRVDIHLVVIVRIVLEGIDFVGEAALERLPEVDIRLVGVERAIRVGGIQEPAVALLLGDDHPRTSGRASSW